MIKPYVEKDPIAFYTYEEFEAGVNTMRQFCSLRSESISMQLASGETSSDMSYVDASGLTLSDMGFMGMGGGFGGGMRGMSGNKENFGGRGSSDGTASTKPNADADNSSNLNIQGTSASLAEGVVQNGEMPTMPEGFDPSQMPDGFPGQFSDGTETTPSDNLGDTDSIGNSNRLSRDNMQMPSGDFNFNMNGMSNTASSSTNWIWLAVSVLILGSGLIIAKLYKH